MENIKEMTKETSELARKIHNHAVVGKDFFLVSETSITRKKYYGGVRFMADGTLGIKLDSMTYGERHIAFSPTGATKLQDELIAEADKCQCCGK